MVGERKKQQYTYYHCTGYKGHCPEPYTREETLTTHFLSVLQDLVIPEPVSAWLHEAIKESSLDTLERHNDTIKRLETQVTRLQERIDQAYLDRLDGRITTAYYDERARAWRDDQERLRAQLLAHNTTTTTHADALNAINLVGEACRLFPQQPPSEQRRLLSILIDKATWQDGELRVNLKTPFEQLRLSNSLTIGEHNHLDDKNMLLGNWLLR